MTPGFPLIGPDGPPDAPWGASVVLWDAARRTVLQLRDDWPEVINGGSWSLFGGGVEPGETLVEAARREVAEELEITFCTDDLRPLGQLIASPRGVRLHVFEALVPISPDQIRLREGAGFGFFTRAQVAELHTTPYLKTLFDDHVSWDTKKSDGAGAL
ncbi:MAG: NUDIX hydrolase [Pseudomonadota bacterium]